MPPRHLDRLTAVDASFLHQESPVSHMHIGALVRAGGPAPLYEEFLDSIRARLHYVPRYRQRLVYPPASTGRPLWADDTDFNLEYHVRHTALPTPGSDEQLTNLAARVFSQQLDRSKPLWELWLVDGIAGVDLGTVLFDLSPEGRPPEDGLEPWTPDPEPSSLDLLAAGVAGMTKASFGVAAKALGSPTRPRRELADFKTVKNVFGGTVNDVVLTVVAGALRHWLHSRGVRTQGLELRALVPVSVRHRDAEQNGTGNRLAVMRGPLPVYVEDPIERLGVVRAAMDDLKESKQAVGAEVLTSMQQFAPPTLLAQASRLNFSTRLFNLLVKNVPGPQFPLYVQGREMTSVFPIAFLPKDHALAIAIMSYNGQMNFGLLGDYDAMPDLDAFGEAIEAALAELVSLASRERRKQAKAVR